MFLCGPLTYLSGPLSRCTIDNRVTRVAWLNPGMWAELFLENREFVLEELNTYITALESYRDAVAGENLDTLIALLDEGKRRKEQVDG